MLGRERCGNVIASYKPVNDKLRVETCWDLSGDNINKRATDSDSNIQEFKEWKNDMRRGTTELNVEQIDDDKRPLSDWAKLNQMMTTFNVDNGLNNDFNNENLFRVLPVAIQTRIQSFLAFSIQSRNKTQRYLQAQKLFRVVRSSPFIFFRRKK